MASNTRVLICKWRVWWSYHVLDG